MNNAIQESYCSFKVERLLEDKGCTLGNERDGLITHALAIEWIRVNFGIDILPMLNLNGNYTAHIFHNKESINKDKNILDFIIITGETPQEATEAALLYVLKELI